MTAVVYPSTLPAPSAWSGEPRERRAYGSLPGLPPVRGRSRDRMEDISSTWVYTPEQMAAWVDWYDNTLLHGTRWFAMQAPGAGGWLDRVFRFRTGSVRREFLARGIWRVSAQLEQRGRGVAPQDGAPVCVGEDFSEGLVPYSTVSGSGSLFEIVAGPYGSALRYAGFTGPTVNAIRRTIEPVVPVRITGKFLVESASTDDACGVSVRTAGAAILVNVQPRRESAFDAAQRVWLGIDGDFEFVGVAACPVDVWHSFEIVVAAGAGNSTYSVVNLDTAVPLGSGTFAGDHTSVLSAQAEMLDFRDDPTLGSAATRFADIEICPAD